MDEIKRAMLGDKEAQRSVTERGELLPCPFCGGEASGICDTTEPFECVVICEHCGTMLGTSAEKKLAFMVWNTRPQLLPAEEMERLEGLE